MQCVVNQNDDFYGALFTSHDLSSRTKNNGTDNSVISARNLNSDHGRARTAAELPDAAHTEKHVDYGNSSTETCCTDGDVIAPEVKLCVMLSVANE